MHPQDMLGAESGRATPWQTIINVATSWAPEYSIWLINQNPFLAILHEARSDLTFQGFYIQFAISNCRSEKQTLPHGNTVSRSTREVSPGR